MEKKIQVFFLSFLIRILSDLGRNWRGNWLCHSDQELSKSRRPLKLHRWFKSYGHFIKGVDFSYWWSFIGKGLRLQPAKQACLDPTTSQVDFLGRQSHLQYSLLWKHSFVQFQWENKKINIKLSLVISNTIIKICFANYLVFWFKTKLLIVR